MKRRLPLLLAILASAATPVAAREAPRSCPGFGTGWASPSEVKQFYADRAVEIVRAAFARDEKALGEMISPAAKFEIWRGDYTSSAREIGVQGMLQMARDVKPSRYRIAIPLSGPISISSNPCHHDAAVIFDTERDAESVEIVFSFVDGKLAAAKGNAARLTQGSIR
jgi:hypothetical protein